MLLLKQNKIYYKIINIYEFLNINIDGFLNKR